MQVISAFGGTVESGAGLYYQYLRGDNGALEQLVIGYGDSLIDYAYIFEDDSKNMANGFNVIKVA